MTILILCIIYGVSLVVLKRTIRSHTKMMREQYVRGEIERYKMVQHLKTYNEGPIPVMTYIPVLNTIFILAELICIYDDRTPNDSKYENEVDSYKK